MEAVESEMVPEDAVISPVNDRPTRLLFYAIGWILAAELAAGFMAFAEALVNIATGSTHPVPAYISFPTALLTTQTVLFLAALHRGRIMAKSSGALAALGLTTTKRYWPILLLGIVITLWTGLFAVIHIAKPPPVPSTYAIDINSALATGGWVTAAVIGAGSIILAPLAEELFFRGWLWEGLAQSWRAVPVMVGTTLPWLLIHVVDNWRALFILMPEAVCFAFARQFCGSARASIALHVLNNVIAVGSIIWFFKS